MRGTQEQFQCFRGECRVLSQTVLPSPRDLEQLIPGTTTGGRGQSDDVHRGLTNQLAAGGVYNFTVISVQLPRRAVRAG